MGEKVLAEFATFIYFIDLILALLVIFFKERYERRSIRFRLMESFSRLFSPLL